MGVSMRGTFPLRARQTGEPLDHIQHVQNIRDLVDSRCLQVHSQKRARDIQEVTYKFIGAPFLWRARYAS